MALIAALLAVSLSAEPARLVLGKDGSATLTIDAPSGVQVTLSSSVGTVGEAKREGNVFRARYTPPSVKAPSVALVLAQIDEGTSRELAWLSIPLAGSDTMEIETRPGSQVQADVAGTLIGPVTADKTGTARLPMVVPPGVSEATLHITDKLGNSTDKPLDLEPPPFSRVRIASRAASGSSAAPLEVEIFVVRPDGAPDDRARVELKPSDGEGEIEKRVAPGVYLARYYAPRGKSGAAHLEAKANGQSAAVDVPMSASRVMLAQPFWRSAMVTQRPWSISLGPVGGGGSTYDGVTTGTVMLEIALRLEVLPVELVIEGGQSWFPEIKQYGSNPNQFARAKPLSRFGQGGLRFGKSVGRSVDLHLTLLFGYQSQVVTVVDPLGAVSSQDVGTPRFAAALGANVRFGPGRALAQLQADSSASGLAGLAGSLGGIQLLLGYLVTVY